MAEREYLIPGSTPVRAVRMIWDPDKPTSQMRIQTAVRIDQHGNIDRREVSIMPRELKFLYEQTVGKQVRTPVTPPPAPVDTQPVQTVPVTKIDMPVPVAVERKKPGPKPKDKSAIPAATTDGSGSH